jgi:hypothetical protein
MIAVVVMVGCGGGETKTCDYCKETDIKYLAEICKHCGKDPDGPNGSEMRLESYKEEAEKKRDKDAPSFWRRREEAFFILFVFVIPSALAVWWYAKGQRARRQKEDDDVD